VRLQKRLVGARPGAAAESTPPPRPTAHLGGLHRLCLPGKAAAAAAARPSRQPAAKSPASVATPMARAGLLRPRRRAGATLKRRTTATRSSGASEPAARPCRDLSAPPRRRLSSRALTWLVPWPPRPPPRSLPRCSCLRHATAASEHHACDRRSRARRGRMQSML
jgi:hypothetical protein